MNKQCVCFSFGLGGIPGQETSQDRCKAAPHVQPSARYERLNIMRKRSTSVHSSGSSNSFRSAVLSTPFLAVLSSVSHWTGVAGSMGKALVSMMGMPALLGSNGILLLCNVLTLCNWHPLQRPSLSVPEHQTRTLFLLLQDWDDKKVVLLEYTDQTHWQFLSLSNSCKTSTQSDFLFFAVLPTNKKILKTVNALLKFRPCHCLHFDGSHPPSFFEGKYWPKPW